MKNIWLLILLIPSLKAVSQKKLEYGDFIQWDNKIEWAFETDQYFDLTPKIPKYSITDWYLKKLKTSGINSYKINRDGYSVSKKGN
ncbi:hypothetical protein [Ferruginibacter albus]|uniref:hypothetical protein n=1 Tax=Ferruginibacter albus TaxID=2875540 RepID=UPI001CC4A734|nr:hypothetical protein [Ferruginibacter albus]UAY53313.1 hypothetical protein K9M53_06485 [Ferruginibacter albus]